MQENAVEVAFCDLCGTSVPANAVQGGAAVRHLGKLVGGCCLPALRGGQAAFSSAGPTAPSGQPNVPGGESRWFPVAVMLLVAIAAATLFLDLELSAADARWQKAHEQLQLAQRGDSDVLRQLDVHKDGAARRADVDAMLGKLQESVAAAGLAQSAQLNEGLQREIAAIRQEIRAVAGQAIDYRPLFEEMRQRQQRLLESVAALRESGNAVAGPGAPVAPPPAATPVEPAGPVLPPALAEHAKKLQATEAAVRFEAVDELLRSKSVEVLPHLLPMAKDADPYVRRLTVDGLRDWKRPEVVDVLLAALTDAEENVRDTAYVSLKLVTGQKLPFEATATKDARARAVQRWTEWWDKNKATFGS